MTLFEVYKDSLNKLKNPEVDEIAIRILLCEINQLKSMSDFYIKKDEEIQDLQRYQEYFQRFLDGEPVQYILKKDLFFGQEFCIDNRVLIPRQESEEVVKFAIDKALEIFGNRVLRVADVCCGSGIMGVILANNLKTVSIIFSDISKDALDVCKINSSKLMAKTRYYCGDALEKLIENKDKIDVLISNPPYILKNEPVDESVLKHEPHIALFTNEEFSVYKDIITNLSNVKDQELLAVFEIGNNSRPVLEKLIKETYPDCEYGFVKDMNGKERILYIYLK